MITISYFSLGFALVSFFLFVVLFVLVSYLVFCMKALLREQHLCLAASFYSLAETRAMKNATVIQRLVEVHHKNKGDKVADITSDFDEFMEEVEASTPKLPRWGKEADTSSPDDIYDPASDPEFKGARDLV